MGKNTTASRNVIPFPSKIREEGKRSWTNHFNTYRTKIIDTAVLDSRLSSGDKELLGFLVSKLNRKKEFIWWSQEEIAVQLRVSRKTIYNRLTRLRKLDYVDWVKKPSKTGKKCQKGWNCNIYRLTGMDDYYDTLKDFSEDETP